MVPAARVVPVASPPMPPEPGRAEAPATAVTAARVRRDLSCSAPADPAVEAELEARAVLAQQCEREIREEDAEREAALEARERERQARRRAAEEAAALAAAGGGGGGGGFGGGGGAEESAAAAGVGGGGGGGGFAADADADGANIAAANADATTAAAAASSEELWVQCSSCNQWRNISPAVHAATVASRPDDAPWLCAMDSERPGAGCHHPCDFELSKRLGLIDPNQQ